MLCKIIHTLLLAYARTYRISKVGPTLILFLLVYAIRLGIYNATNSRQYIIIFKIKMASLNRGSSMLSNSECSTCNTNMEYDGDNCMWSSQLDTQSEDEDGDEEVDMISIIPGNPSKEETMSAIQILTTCIVLSIEQLWDNWRLNHFPTKPDLVVVVKKLLSLSQHVKLFWPFNFEHTINQYLQKMRNRITELSAPVDRRSYCDVIEDVYSSASYMAEALGDLSWLPCVMLTTIKYKWFAIWMTLCERVYLFPIMQFYYIVFS